MLKTCTDCGGAITRRAGTFDAHIGRRTVSAPGEYDRCADCGEFYFAPGEMDEMMKRASGIVRAEEGLLLPGQIKVFRKGIGLTQPQLEDLLGAGPKTVGRWEKGTVIQNGATDTLLRLLMDMPEALQHLLVKRGIVPNIVPLVPAQRTVSYPEDGSQPTADLIAYAEAQIGGELQVVLADYFVLARDVTNFAGALIERVEDQPGDARAVHVGFMILARQVTELQACAHLVRLGYSAQAVSLAATMLELMHVGAYIGADEVRADDWMRWDNPRIAYPGRISDTIAAVAKRFGLPEGEQSREYDEVYRQACTVKHANPMAMGATNVALTDEAFCIVAGPIRTMANSRLAHAAMQWAVRYTLLCAIAFIADHLSEGDAAPLMPVVNDLRRRQQVLAAAAIKVFPPG